MEVDTPGQVAFSGSRKARRSAHNRAQVIGISHGPHDCPKKYRRAGRLSQGRRSAVTTSGPVAAPIATTEGRLVMRSRSPSREEAKPRRTRSRPASWVYVYLAARVVPKGDAYQHEISFDGATRPGAPRSLDRGGPCHRETSGRRRRTGGRGPEREGNPHGVEVRPAGGVDRDHLAIDHDRAACRRPR